MPTEHSIQNAVMRWLAMHDHVRVFRQNTGAHVVNGQMVRYGVPGQADLRCIVGPGGWLWEIEVKNATGRQSKAQVNYESMLRSMGAEYTLARCVEDAWQAACSRWPDLLWRTPAEVTA